MWSQAGQRTSVGSVLILDVQFGNGLAAYNRLSKTNQLFLQQTR